MWRLRSLIFQLFINYILIYQEDFVNFSCNIILPSPAK